MNRNQNITPMPKPNKETVNGWLPPTNPALMSFRPSGPTLRNDTGAGKENRDTHRRGHPGRRK